VSQLRKEGCGRLDVQREDKDLLKMYRTKNLYSAYIGYGVYKCLIACESKELAFQLIKDHIITNRKEELDDNMIIMPTIEMIHEVPKNKIYDLYYAE